MIKNKLNNFDVGTLNYFITRAFLTGFLFNALLNLIKQDSWIIPIAGIGIGIFFILIIVYIFNYKPKLNFSEKLTYLFSKQIGSILVIIFCISLCKTFSSKFLSKIILAAPTFSSTLALYSW